MDRSDVPALRSLPRTFLPGAALAVGASIEIPQGEYKKLHDVLRIRSGALIALLPGDGSVAVCRLEGRSAVVLEVAWPETEAGAEVGLCLALSKPDSLEDSVRMATELGVAWITVFPSHRSVVKWTPDKWEAKLNRLRTIAMEACEVSFRTRLPVVDRAGSLADILEKWPGALVLSESESVEVPLAAGEGGSVLVVGPEGGWDKAEIGLIGERSRSLGKRVLRVSTAVAAACALVLANR